MIAVIGDIMLDEYIYGSSIRQSPECDTAPVVVVNSPIRSIGGAGNTALNIHYLEGDVKLYCAVSGYSHLPELLRTSGIKQQININLSPDVVKTRIYSNGQYIARLDIDSKIRHYELGLVEDLIKDKPNIVIISDYGKGTINNPSNIIKQAKDIGAITIVDSKSNLYDFKGATIIKPNLKEFFEWSGIEQPKDLDDAINRLHKGLLESALGELEVDNLIITLGERGCIHVYKSGMHMYPALPIKSVDVTGAGDSFIAGLAVALSEGKGIKRAIQFANRAASVAVTKKGTQYVKRNEI
jgi:D-beta-D-heptose 7-phosphate kinase / D-beta-D-heptose 1-phosphate adenosyltransferase